MKKITIIADYRSLSNQGKEFVRQEMNISKQVMPKGTYVFPVWKYQYQDDQDKM